ncbi:hypothetical protein U1Q18_024861, partial [Sarracenia purpurea var. burkii]
ILGEGENAEGGDGGGGGGRKCRRWWSTPEMVGVVQIRRMIAEIADGDLDIDFTVGATGEALQIQLAGGALTEVGLVDEVAEGETGGSDEWLDVGVADAGVYNVDVEGP